MDTTDDEIDVDEPDSEHGNRCCRCCCQRRRRRHLQTKQRNCSTHLAKLCLIIPNAIFVVVGFSVIGFGAWIRLDRESLLHLELLRHLPTVGPVIALDRFPVVVISVGCSVAILSLLGCCGACAESASCLCLYTFLLVVVLSAEVVLVIVGFTMHERVLASMGESLKQEIVLNYNTSLFDSLSSEERTFVNYFSKSWDSIQTKFNCCGSFGPGDYELSAWANRTKKHFYKDTLVPATCCHLTGNRSDVSSTMINILWDCQRDAHFYLHTNALERAKGNLKTEGCHRLIFEATERTVSVVVSVICSVVVLQIANFIIGCFLLRYLRRQQEDIWLGSVETIT